MKRFIKITALALGVLVVAAALLMQIPAVAQNVDCYFAQGGSSFNAGSGCTINVDSGGSLVLDSGSTFTNASATTHTGPHSVDLDDTTDGVVNNHTMSHSSSDNNATAGDGTGLSFELENATGTSLVEEWASFDVISQVITDGSEDGQIAVSLMLGGTVAGAYGVDGTDQSFTVGENVTNTSGVHKVRIFPVTTAKGSVVWDAIANSGDTILTYRNASQGQATVLTTPDIGQSTGFLALLKAAQTVEGEFSRADLTEDSLAAYQILFSELLENGGAAGVVGNSDSQGSNDHYITENAGVWKLFGNTPSSTTETDTSIFMFQMPPEYVDSGTVTVRLNALYTTIGDTQTLDLTCYEAAEAGTVGSELVTTTIKTLTASATNFDFTVTASGLVSGDRLHCEFVTVFQDSDGSVGEAQINYIAVLVDIKG